MSMNGDTPERPNVDGKADATECEPGCDCDAAGLNKKSKVIVCLVIGLAAAAVLARGVTRRAAAEKGNDHKMFAAALPGVQTEKVIAQMTNAAQNAVTEDTRPTLSRTSLDSLASLNKVASEKDAVFVLVPSERDEELEAIGTQIASAVDKIRSGGTTIAAFTLDRNAKDYAQLVSEVGAPCVLTMVKGRGMSVVSNDISEANLLQALVAASRPSGCGPAAGPSCCP